MLNLVNLDERTREYMAGEVQWDVAAGTLHFSDRLSEAGRRDYLTLLEEGVKSHTTTGLPWQLRQSVG